jgi:hypothetical protein
MRGGIALLWGETDRKFLALKVHRKCPLVLLLKVIYRESEKLGSEEHKAMVSRLFCSYVAEESEIEQPEIFILIFRCFH